MPTVVRHAKAWGVEAGTLGAMFGQTARGVWIDVARGMHPAINGPAAVSEDAETKYAVHRALMRTWGEPVPPLARVH